MRPVTARGFRDVLPAEAAEREAVSRTMAEVFSAWGYGLVETPVVEDLAALEAAAGSLEGTAFRLIDLDGRLLALRPDMTVPIARITASRLAGQPGPHRFRYAAEVFREHESLRGQARQFSQAGVELVGAAGPAADAEVLAVLVEALAASGLREFTVAVGTVAVLSALVAAADAPESWGEAVLAAAHDRNLVGLDALAREAGNPDVAAALSAVPRIRGGREAIAACRAATAGLGCDGALDEFEATLELLDVAGVLDRVVVDFSVMRSFDYYTGLVAEAYARRSRAAACGRWPLRRRARRVRRARAGRRLRASASSALMIALVEQGAQPATRSLDAAVGGEPAAALAAARRLRQAGWRVALSARSGRELVAEATRLEAAEALVATATGDRAARPRGAARAAARGPGAEPAHD